VSYNYQEFIDYVPEDLFIEPSLFGSEKFLRIISNVYECDIKYAAVFFKGKPVLFMPLLIKNKRVISPNHYFYQFIWINSNIINSWSQIEAMDFFLEQLIKRYKSIKFKLPPDLVDVRPFIWRDFKIASKFTYIKDLNSLDYHQNIKRILKRNINDFSFQKDEDWDKVWVLHFNNLLGFGLRKSRVEKIISMMKKLKDNNFLHTFNISYRGVFVTSIISVIDVKCGIAYFPLIGTTTNYSEKGLSAHLYDLTFSKLIELGINDVDLMGANMKSISRFKNKFNPELRHYYEVSYKKKIMNFNIKRILLRFLIKI